LADLKATAEGENIPVLHNTFETGKVILTTLGPLPNAFPKLLVEIASDPRFTLYRVERPDPSESRRAWRSNSLFLPLD
jgi:hypothetical protein